MTQLTDEEMGWIKNGKAHIVHCPSSNLKLASGSCPVSALLKMVRVLLCSPAFSEGLFFGALMA